MNETLKSIKNVPDSRVPLLLIHSGKDTKSFIQQLMQYTPILF